MCEYSERGGGRLNTVLPYVAKGQIASITGLLSQVVVDFSNAWDEKPCYSTKVLVTDHEWNQAGDKIIVQVMPNTEDANAEIWLVELPLAY